MSVLIEGARIIDPQQSLDAVLTLAVQGSEVLAIGAAPPDFEPRRRIDATGLWLFPGLVDLATRAREPGQEHKATIASEALAAARGGITTLVVSPDTQPPIDSPAVVELITRRAGQACGTRMHCLGALTRDLKGEQLAEMAALQRAGVVGVSNAQRPLANPLVLRRALEYAATFDLLVSLTALDMQLVGSGCVHEGMVSTRLGLPGIPEAAETAALGTILALIEQTGARIHIQRLSSLRGAQMIAEAKARGLPITADVAVHQLFLTEMDVADFNPLCHVLPPLRTQRDRDGLREHIAAGVIDAICSDHQPHEADAKLAPFAETQPGISGLETLLHLTLRLVEEGLLTLPDALRRVTVGPAAIIRRNVGTLQPGRPADFVLFDPDRATMISPANWVSNGRNTPFFGWEFSGRVVATWVSGRPVWTDSGAS